MKKDNDGINPIKISGRWVEWYDFGENEYNELNDTITFMSS